MDLDVRAQMSDEVTLKQDLTIQLPITDFMTCCGGIHS